MYDTYDYCIYWSDDDIKDTKYPLENDNLIWLQYDLGRAFYSDYYRKFKFNSKFIGCLNHKQLQKFSIIQ